MVAFITGLRVKQPFTLAAQTRRRLSTVEHLLSCKQVAAIMQIDLKKVQRLARTGVIPSIRLGSVYRFRETTLDAWIEDNEVSERKSTKKDAQERGTSLGVSVSGRERDDEAAYAESMRLCVRGIGKG